MGFFDKLVKEITRPAKSIFKETLRPVEQLLEEQKRVVTKVYKTEANRIVGDIKGEVSRSPELRAGLKIGLTAVGVPAPVASMAVESLRRPEKPKKGAIPSPILTGPGIVPDGPPIMKGQETVTKEPPGPKSDIESWAWTNKYLQAQRQVAQAKAIKPPTEPVEQLTIEKVALPAAGIGLAWWLLKGF
ncbi:hypothetical protein LCGC14_1075800 [marine sediment metagenome]|uniref:Uncharacterized protein n=1 Tax=marine sediment metagenome TaxID=412755 RepID=A0A0F9PZW9_9ZZZZ